MKDVYHNYVTSGELKCTDMERIQLGEKWCFGRRKSQFRCIWFSLWITFTSSCFDLVTSLQNQPWKTSFYAILGNVISYWVSCCVRASCFLFALPVGCVDFHLMCGITWECAFVEEGGHQQMGMSIKCSQLLCAWNILVEFGSSSSWWISGAVRSPVWDSAEQRVPQRRFAPFLFILSLSHSNLCSCFVGDTVAWGNFGLTVKAQEAWKKKQSLWNSLFKNLPIVRGLWTPAALGW